MKPDYRIIFRFFRYFVAWKIDVSLGSKTGIFIGRDYIGYYIPVFYIWMSD